MKKNIKLSYQNNEHQQQINLQDPIYAKIAEFLSCDQENLIIIVDNDYKKMIPRNAKFQQYQSSTQFNAYNIKELLREKIENLNKQKECQFNKEQNNYPKIHSCDISLGSTQCTTTIVQSFITPNDQKYTENTEIQKSDQILNSSTFSSQNETQSDFFNSVAKQQFQMCYKCNNKILETCILTNCQHYFHQECLEEYLRNQLNKQLSNIVCICNQQINQKFLINNFKNGNQMNEILYRNQLSKIQQDNQQKIEKCNQKNNCSFIYINKDNPKISSPFCPFCCEVKKS